MNLFARQYEMFQEAEESIRRYHDLLERARQLLNQQEYDDDFLWGDEYEYTKEEEEEFE